MDMIHRTTFERKYRKNTPDYDPGVWLIVPDLKAASPAGVLEKYQKVVGDTIVERTQAEKDTVDASNAATIKAQKEARIKSEVTHDPLEGYAVDIQISGLTLTTNIESVVVNDVTTVVADGTDTKFVMLCYVYNETTDTLSIQAFEKTTGVYDDVGLDEHIVKDLGEWSVGANGSTLTET